MSTLFFTEEEQKQFEAELREIHFASSMGFLNAHNGFRRGSLHMVIGTAGGGKSTLVRTLIRDFLFQKDNARKTLALCLSEETIPEYKRQLAYGIPSHDILLNTIAVSELEDPNWNKKKFFEWLREFTPDFLVFDNITTSKWYMDLNAKEQSRFAVELKSITKEVNCSTLLIAHTDADITDGIERLIHLNDIRGSKSIVNLVEFGYILQRFQIGDKFFPTIRTVKHRSQELIHALYSLVYDPRTRSFTSDNPLNFEKFKEIFSERNRLK
jgi:ABC-type iron transport system FetAB ATPase subunit